MKAELKSRIYNLIVSSVGTDLMMQFDPNEVYDAANEFMSCQSQLEEAKKELHLAIEHYENNKFHSRAKSMKNCIEDALDILTNQDETD